MRPLYESLIRTISSLGPDVDVSPKKTCVSLRRSKQFALIQPTGQRTRSLPDTEGRAPCRPAGAEPDHHVHHRVKVSKEAEVDPELIAWLRQAYDAA